MKVCLSQPYYIPHRDMTDFNYCTMINHMEANPLWWETLESSNGNFIASNIINIYDSPIEAQAPTKLIQINGNNSVVQKYDKKLKKKSLLKISCLNNSRLVGQLKIKLLLRTKAVWLKNWRESLITTRPNPILKNVIMTINYFGGKLKT